MRINSTIDCCYCPREHFDIVPIIDHGQGDWVSSEYTTLRLEYDLPDGYVLSFVGSGGVFGLRANLVAPAAFQVAIPFGQQLGIPDPALFAVVPDAEYDSFVTPGDYVNPNNFSGGNPDLFNRHFGAEGVSSPLALWNRSVGLNSSDAYVAATDRYLVGPWNTGSAVVFQLTIRTVDFDQGCGAAPSACPTALIGGLIDPLGTPATAGVYDAAYGDMYNTRVQMEWVRSVRWEW